MLWEMSTRPMMGSRGDGFSSEGMGSLLREQRRQQASDWERELNMCRSGSAPPTVEGSLNAIGGLLGCGDNGGVMNASGAKQVDGFASEEELLSDPAYLQYYHSHANMNPRLPPPLLSKEDWRFTQRLQAGNSTFGGIGDKRTKPNQLNNEGNRSLFSQEELEVEPWRAAGSSEWLENGGDGLIGLPGIELSRQKKYDTTFQDELGHATPAPGYLSRPASRSAFNDDAGALNSADTQFDLQNKIRPADGLWCGTNFQSTLGVQTNGFPASHTFDSVLDTVHSNNSDGADKKPKNNSVYFNNGSTNVTKPGELMAAFSAINLSEVGAANKDMADHSTLRQEIEGHENFIIGLEGSQNLTERNKNVYDDMVSDNEISKELSITDLKHDGMLDVSKFSSSSSPSSTCLPNANDMNATFSSYGLGGFSIDPALSSMIAKHNNASSSPLFGNAAVAAGMTFPGIDSRATEGYFSESNLNGANNLHNHKGNRRFTGPFIPQISVDPLYVQYLRAGEYAAQTGIGFNDPSMEMGYMANSYADLLKIQKAYLGVLLESEKNYGMPFINKSADLVNGYYGSLAFGLGYPGSPASPVPPASLSRLGSPLRNSIADHNMHFPSTIRNLNEGMIGAWHADNSCMMYNTYTSSLLDEFKNNKTKCIELSEIGGHVVEFSTDQYGSRFIQQKLETATKEGKDMVFKEIMPQALTLMTDVFGNYVVQKFFEHGSAAQIRELANQLTGHVLALSLQMYGCRVIQKAIEVVELDQKTKMVAELDGHVMRCVRDQNGNHVIQKCIECIPEDAIQFIVSTFYSQTVTLSTHPYGCRVIQRVLEHCHDIKTQQIMMEEILQSVCVLAQDQYGNYVVQHVVEHGKPHERSAIINKLSGQIVQMSQQKFASNVIEKCLTFGNSAQRQSLVNEMLGSADLTEPLEVMMKDQFANYVVQKVLETCDNDQREIILTRIKVHLTALKKYTYGKHIVARVEKLVAAGERRVVIQSACSS